MKIVCGPDLLPDELEILVALAESIRFDRNAWKNAAYKLAEAYSAATGIETRAEELDLPAIEFLLEEIKGQPVDRGAPSSPRRQVH